MIARVNRVSKVCLALCVLLVGCGGGGARNDYFYISDPTVTLVRGETRSQSFRVIRSPMDPPGVLSTVTVEGLPEGVTGTVTPTTYDMTNNTTLDGKFTLTADRGVVATTYNPRLRRTLGQQSGSLGFKLKVVDFAVDVDVDTTSITLRPGQSQDVEVTLHRRGDSTGTVEMDLGGDLPDGVSVSFDPQRVTIDADHPTRTVTMTYSADWNAGNPSTQESWAKALKGANVNKSDHISVTLDVPVESDSDSQLARNKARHTTPKR